jgi:TRAP-type C4-dicarboxylate transport system substrate-binding protein
VARFVEQVEERSEGRLQVEVQSFWQGGNDEANVIRDVAAGDADLGWAGSRIFADFGADSMRALSAPFLIDSYPLQAAVLRDGQDLLLHDVEAATGTQPLAVVADALRYPVSLHAPLLRPVDWRGLAMRTVPGADQVAAFADLGAEPIVGGGFTDGLDAGTVDGGELGWEGFVVLHVVDRAPYITVNAALWPRADVLFADPDLLDDLSGDERRWVDAAAADALDWSLDHAADSEPQFQRRACELGAQAALATPHQLDRLRAATEGTYAKLSEEPAVARLLDWIASVKATMPPPTPPDLPGSCHYSADREPVAPGIEPLSAPGPRGRLPEGVYRYRLSSDDLLQLGVDAMDAELYAGLATWTIRDGHWNLDWLNDSDHTSQPCSGLYAVHRGLVHFTRTQDMPDGDCSPPDWTARWTETDGGIRWHDLTAYPSTFQDFEPWFVDFDWTRIG